MPNPIPWSRRSKTSHDLRWQCLAVGDDFTHASMQYPHLCTLAKQHWGNHLCWCGWSFSKTDAYWRQDQLPL